MTPDQVRIVKETWGAVKPISAEAAALFYGRLFATDPSTQPLFAKADMQEQGKKLMATIGFCVASLDRLPEIVPQVQALGMRHVDYRVRPEHYASVGAALLWTLEQGLGDKFTADAKEAWTLVYTTLAEVMQAAAAQKA